MTGKCDDNPTGDAAGLRQTLADNREEIRRYILSIVRDASEAEDLTQETLLKAHKSLDTLQDAGRLLPWLFRIATNACRDRFRQASFRHRPETLDEPVAEGELTRKDTIPDEGPRLDHVMEQKEMSACVQDYVSRLSDEFRAVILLHDCEGLSNPEIAEMLDLPLSTVKMRLHRARNRLRGFLKRACVFRRDEHGEFICERKQSEDED